MSGHKIGGCCSLCDEPAFEILQRWDAGEKRAGEPKRLGPPLEGSMRVTFRLFDGTLGDFTFCGECVSSLDSKQFTRLWNKNLAGYLREQDGKTEKFIKQFDNGLLFEVGRQSWKDLIDA